MLTLKTKRSLIRSLIPCLLVPLLTALMPVPLAKSANKAGAAALTASVPAPATPSPLPLAKSKPPAAPVPRPKPLQARLKPPQRIKDATAAVCARVGDNRVDILAEMGISPGIFRTTCYNDLLAMAWKESRYRCHAVGDGGKSRGCFQIQTRLHGVSVAHADDYAWAAEWTVDRMVKNHGYPRFRSIAIIRHNGAGAAARAYAASVKDTSESFLAAGL